MPRRPRPTGAVHVVTNRRSEKGREYVTHLLRRSYREGGKVKNETVGNISHLPQELVEVIRAGLRGEPVGVLCDGFLIERSLPAGHVIAALAMARRLTLARLLDRRPSRERDLCIAMILARAIVPMSSPVRIEALTRSILTDELGLVGADGDDLHAAMDWLGSRQTQIESRLARRHLARRGLALYAVSSWRSEACCCGPTEQGCVRVREGGGGWICGVLCDGPGRPIAVEMLSGGVCDDTALAPRISELATRFGLARVLACDRAMLAKASRESLRAAEGARWIASFEAPRPERLADGDAPPTALGDRVCADAFLRMLAYYLAWHLRRVWAPLLLTDEHPSARPTAIAGAGPLLADRPTAQSTGAGERVHNYGSLLAELASLSRNTIRLRGNPTTFAQLSRPTPLQACALELAEHASLSA